MAEYIERETYRNRLADLESWCQDERKPGLKQALEMFDEVPAADVAPVVHGLWESVDSSYWRWTPSGGVSVAHITYRCERCGRGTVVKTDYCPNCGAKMDGGAK